MSTPDTPLPCQHDRWFKLPSGTNGVARCGKEPTTERERIDMAGRMAFRTILWLCDNHTTGTSVYQK